MMVATESRAENPKLEIWMKLKQDLQYPEGKGEKQWRATG